MKVFDLQCEELAHIFEGWFASHEDYDSQQARGLVSCPVCGSDRVIKRLSAPRLNVGHFRDPDAVQRSAEGAVAAPAVAVLAVLCLLSRRTDLGVSLYAIGADEVAAGLSGIPVRRARCAGFVIAGVFYGAAGFMLSAQTSTGDPNAGLPFLLLSFAAVALGGTSLGGGQGGAIGSMIGAGVLLLMQKMLFAVGVSSFYTGLFQGVLLIVAILVERGLSRLRQAGRNA